MKSSKLYQTRGIYETCRKDQKFNTEIIQALEKYLSFDWGDTCKEDKRLNDMALKNGDRIVAKYETSKGDIFIITEVDRKVTTVLFAHEY